MPERAGGGRFRVIKGRDREAGNKGTGSDPPVAPPPPKKIRDCDCPVIF